MIVWPHGLDVLVDDSRQLLNAAGQGTPGLHYVGPLLKEQFWEAAAVPELRVHAQRAALHCVEGLGG